MVPEPRSAYALRFFLLAAALLAVGGSLSLLLIRCFPPATDALPNQFSLAFGVSTGLLLMGAATLFRAVRFVRREQQQPFRRSLYIALGLGTLFVGVQTFALACLIRQQPPDEASTGAGAFIVVFAALHGMHFLIAMMFLCFITVQAAADRYDHEYFWGVTLCAWFWHSLGLVWLAILVVILIARFYG